MSSKYHEHHVHVGFPVADSRENNADAGAAHVVDCVTYEET